MSQFSVLIIVKGRRDHLLNVLAGIRQSSVQPHDIVIVHMNEAAYALPAIDITITQDVLHDKHPLPLAKARNRAAALAKTNQLIFLDVDCIPAPDCFEKLLSDTPDNVITMVDPYYTPHAVSTVDFSELSKIAKPNKARSQIAFGKQTNYGLFWSLGFCINRSTFDAIGGFDENYTGYGAEDTDFSFSAEQAGVSLLMSEARVYHQYHKSYDPPLNWLEDIVVNAHVFKDKWGRWPMEHWLQGFADKGYIDWQPDKITVLSLPSQAAIDATLVNSVSSE